MNSPSELRANPAWRRVRARLPALQRAAGGGPPPFVAAAFAALLAAGCT